MVFATGNMNLLSPGINNNLGIPFTNDMTGPSGRKGHWGDGKHWDETAQELGYKVTRTPKVGAIAQWNKRNLDHVVFVAKVSSDQKIVTVEVYDWDNKFSYGIRQIPADRIDNFIHIEEWFNNILVFRKKRKPGCSCIK